jgi:aerobic carbon-monoxide dehydrogenase large subunit
MAGIVAERYTGASIGPTPEFTLLATDKVRFVGDPVAIVIAENRYLAEDGCELVAVRTGTPR